MTSKNISCRNISISSVCFMGMTLLGNGGGNCSRQQDTHLERLKAEESKARPAILGEEEECKD